MLDRFRRNRRGSAAVEFALVAPLFFCMLFAIIETAIVFFAGQVLEHGTAESARLMMTRQAQDSGMNETAFKTDLCNRIKVMFNCHGNLGDHYRRCEGLYAGHRDHDHRSDRQWKPDRTFLYSLPPSGSSNTIVVRAFYQWPLFVTGLGLNLANLNGSKRLLAATAAFHVEP